MKLVTHKDIDYVLLAMSDGMAEVVEIKTGKAHSLVLSPGETSTLKTRQESKASVIPSLKTLERRPTGWITRMRQRREKIVSPSRKRQLRE